MKIRRPVILSELDIRKKDSLCGFGKPPQVIPTVLCGDNPEFALQQLPPLGDTLHRGIDQQDGAAAAGIDKEARVVVGTGGFPALFEVSGIREQFVQFFIRRAPGFKHVGGQLHDSARPAFVLDHVAALIAPWGK